MHYNTIYCQIYFGIYWISHSGWNIMLTAGEKYVVNNAICVYHAAGFLEKKKKKVCKIRRMQSSCYTGDTFRPIWLLLAFQELFVSLKAN